MFEFVIGSRLAENEALQTLKQECGEFNFPHSFMVENLMPRDIVDSSINLFLDSVLKEAGESTAEISFPTFGHLMKFVTDMEFIAKLSDFPRAICLRKVDKSDATESNSKSRRNKQNKEVNE